MSGGLDSATVLAYAESKGYQCFALSIDYGQRHLSELRCAEKLVRSRSKVEHKILSVDLSQIGGSSLTDLKESVPTESSSGIPSTYVPARNTVMLSLALAWSEVIDSRDIFIGANAVDYSGYPDCRPEYIKAYEDLANLATKTGVEGVQLGIHAPLIDLKKSDIIKMGMDLGVDFSMTVSCYQANKEGEACGMCDSCRIRRKGFIEAGVEDPTRYA